MAAFAAVAAAAAFYLLAWQDAAHFHRSIDFNAAPFEDFSGPYFGMAQEVFDGGRPVPGFLYSPFFAIALGVLFEGASPAVASWSWLAFQVLATLALVLLPLGLLARPLGPRGLAAYLFVALTSVPLVHNHHWGQVGVAVTALVLAAFVAHARGARVAAALALSLAIAIKFYPAVFLLWFVLREDLRTLGASLAFSLLLLVGVPMAVLGAETTWEFYRSVAGSVGAAEAAGGAFAEASSRQYAPAVVARWLGVESGGIFVALQAAGYLLAGANLVALWRAPRGDPRRDALRAFVVVSLSLPLVLSPSWLHYLAFLPACQLFLATHPGDPLGGRETTLRLRVGRACLALSVLCSSMLLFRLHGRPLAYAAQGWLFAADALALLACHLGPLRAAPSTRGSGDSPTLSPPAARSARPGRARG